MTSAPWQHWDGQNIEGRFPLLRRLGSGDDSAVFLTELDDPEPRSAALKLVRMRSPESPANRWERAARLTHPHLIRLFRTGTCVIEDTPLSYVVMEYADENLAAALRERPLTEAEAREMLESVLDALAYVHGQGLAHGRLKPDNIMAVGDRLKISSDTIAAPGELTAGPAAPDPYEAPEVRTQGVSAAADVWSLGMTLVEAVTQQLPRASGTKPDIVLPAMPSPFQDVARWCLQVDPRRRATLTDILARLRQPAATPQPRSMIAPAPISSRARYLAPAAALTFAAILAGVGLLHRRSQPQTPAPLLSQATALPDRAAPAAPPPPPPAPSQTGSADRQGLTAAIPKPPARPSGPDVVRQALPEVPAKARQTITGTVRVAVRVHVDPAGRVTRADIDSEGPSRYFANLAVQSARRWEFQRLPQGGGALRQWLLRFEFTNTATRARAFPAR
jgi:TonB family protein